jgi:hypothetical protein
MTPAVQLFKELLPTAEGIRDKLHNEIRSYSTYALMFRVRRGEKDFTAASYAKYLFHFFF